MSNKIVNMTIDIKNMDTFDEKINVIKNATELIKKTLSDIKNINLEIETKSSISQNS
ncbi:MAG: hypothetical protein GY830_05455 [Bacteroidetes bacterium]|nr:hypothetical protein [Bacteroidota bacterium]